MKDQIAVGPGVAPGFVRLESRCGVAGAAGRLAVANVDDSPIVKIPAPGAIPLDDVVMPVVGSQLEILAGIEETPVMLAKSFAVSAQLGPVPLAPKAPQIARPLLAPLLIELTQNAVRGNGGKIGSITRYGG